MFENRNLRQDLFALGLTAFCVLLVFSLATYDPADNVGHVLWPISLAYQPDQLVFPANEQVQNICGRTGAVLADVMLNCLGMGAYYLTGSLCVLAGWLLMRREVTAPAMRTGGWLLSLTGIVALFAILLPSASPGPVIGSGGYLGALARDLLTNHFAVAGAVILSLSLTLGGLLLCTDYVLLQLAGAAFRPMVVGLGSGVKVRFAKAKERRRRRREDAETVDPDALKGMLAAANDELSEDEVDEGEEYEDEVEEESTGPRIKFLGRKQEEEEVAEGDAECEDEEAEYEDGEEDGEYEEDEIEEDEDAEEEAPAAQQTVPAPKFLGAPRVKNNNKKKLTANEEKQAARAEVMQTLDAAAGSLDEVEDYELPSLDLLQEGGDVSFEAQEMEVLEKARQLEQTFQNFGFNVKVVEIETGPVIAQYEIELEAGLRLSKITNLADDLAIALRVPSVRIVAPIPGKNTVGIEVPNTNRQMVRLRDVMTESSEARINKMAIPIYLGKDVSGHPMVEDLARMPHLLIAGRTGTGKSVCLNAIISSMLMTRRPDEVRMLMIDPKMVELSGYGSLPHLMHPVVTDMRKAEAILAWAVEKMEERYSLLAKAGVRQISSYNQLSEEELYERLDIETEEDKEAVPLHLPYIVIVADEIADLMMVAGKDVEAHIIRLAQKSRAVGIHLILATQKPTVDVITGLIKSNLPARLSFQVASRTDSRVVLDEMGAEKLLGDGDMLFLKPGTSQLLRGQGTYLSDDEIDGIVGAVSTGEQNFVAELVSLKPKSEDGEEPGAGGLKNRDDLYESAVDTIVREQRGSCSLLQRSLGIGYGRAARLIDFMAEDNIVGPYAGSQAREVLLSIEDWERMQGQEAAEEPSDAQAAAEEALAEAAEEPLTVQPQLAKVKSVKKKRRSNRIIPVPDYDEEDELEDELEDEAADNEDAEDDDAADEYEEGEYDEDKEGDYEYDEDGEYEEDEYDEDAEYEEGEYEDEEEFAETA